MKKTIQFLAVVYNNFTDTLAFCESIDQQFETPNVIVRCVLIDNSTNGEISNQLDALRKVFKFVEIVKTPTNLGYFGAFNYYFETSYRDVGLINVICNNDLKMDQNFCHQLAKANYPSSVLVVCPDVVTKDGHHQNPHRTKAIGYWQKLKLDMYFSNIYLARSLVAAKALAARLSLITISKAPRLEGPAEIREGIGACYVLLPNFVKDGFRLHFPCFLFGEEVCLSWQVRNAGGKMWFDPNLKVWHAESATFSKLPKRQTYKYGQDSYWKIRKYF